VSAPDIEVIVAPNPGPMTLEGTNTYLVGRDPTVVIDPGPADEGHIEAIRKAAGKRGGIGTLLVTHGHGDHSDGTAMLDVSPTVLGDGEAHGGIGALETPGHAEDHFCFLLPPGHPAAGKAKRTICFSGDLILGEGSTIVGPRDFGGSLSDYMSSLRKLEELDLEAIYPGHGPIVKNPDAKIAEYVEHREMRERRLLEALEAGERSRMALLNAVWDDVPAELRPMAAYAMQAHLEKLADEGRLPDDLDE
jgi:glyoxylase-like metal-dependent hydrolase (beta-lactamase superfamily II)